MYVCQECKSTEFEKVDGFLYCLVCQVQQKDYIEYMAETDVIGENEFETTENTQELPKENKLIDNWTAWDSYNLILHGFVEELSATGLAPKKLKSVVLSLWMGYLAKTAKEGKKSTRKKRTKTSSQQTKSQRMSSQKSLQEDLESLHIGKKRKVQQKNYDDWGLTFTPLSQSCAMRTLQKNMIDRCYKDFVLSEKKNFGEIFANETIETIGRNPKDGPDALNATYGTDVLSFLNRSKRRCKVKPKEKKQVKKTIPMSKAIALEILHIGLLMCGSDIQLSDLLRFIREGHLSYAKVTHFFPPEIKLTKENYSYLETVNVTSMPSHVHGRRHGVEVLKILEINQLPAPDFPRLIKRYVTELRLPVLVSSYAVLLSRLGNFEKLCSLKRMPKRIPNYEGMAAACIIVALKFLFGLDDRTEFLLSDMAKKTNKILKLQLGNDNSVKLFQFVEWKTLIELRKTILSGVHYPTQEAMKQNLSTIGFMDMIIKESKDRYREERFQSYTQYYMKAELLAVCRAMLDTLIEPKDKYTMEFPPTLRPQTKYLKAIIKDYKEKKKQKNPESSSGCIQFSEIPEWAMTLLVKRYEERQVFFMHRPTAYKELLRKNGYKIRTLSKRDQVKLMADCKDLGEKSEDEYDEEDEEYTQDDSDSDLEGEDISDPDEDGVLNKKAKVDEEIKLGEEANMDEDDNVEKESKPDDCNSNETDAANKMDVDEEEPEIRSGDSGKKKTVPPLDEEEEGIKMKPNPRNWARIIVKEDGKEFRYYVGKPENRSFKKIDSVPKKKYKGSSWSDINYSKLNSSKKVYFVKDMGEMWKLDPLSIPEKCDRLFTLQVFRKTPQNFQWITRQFAHMLDMRVKEIYIECYKLELALEKAKKFSPAKIRNLIK